jgi:hypothetical protein
MVEITISIKTSEDAKVEPAAPAAAAPAAAAPAPVHSLVSLQRQHEELVSQMGDEISPFPGAKMGGYLSHFRITMRFDADPLRGKIVSVVSPPAAQSVAWSAPFVYEGPGANHTVAVPVPSRSGLATTISERDFLERPAEFFELGKETLWLQIINLDARMKDDDLGPMRIILGETVKRQYPDIFKPSLGAAQSLGSRGFPAKLFFNPYAIIETRFGAFRAVHGVLSYGRVTAFPPIGTPVTTAAQIPIEHVETVLEAVRANDPSRIQEIGKIMALTHPIDMEIHETGEGAYDFVNSLIEAGAAAARQ